MEQRRGLGAWNLSHDVLAQRPHDLLVVQADDLGWSDWGTPEAIVKTVSALGLTPPWLSAPLTEARVSASRGPKYPDVPTDIGYDMRTPVIVCRIAGEICAFAGVTTPASAAAAIG